MLEAERALLCSLIISPEKIYTIGNMIKAEMIYATKHQELYKAILILHKNNKPIELTTLNYVLQKLQSKMSPAELVEISNAIPTGETAEYYAELVREEYTRREIGNVLKRELPNVENKSKDPNTLISDIISQLDTLSPLIAMQESSIYPDIVNIWEEYIDVGDGSEPNWITTGFTDLDKVIYLAGGTHTIIGASPSEGKTSLGICILRNVSATGKRVLFISMEQARKRILKKIISQASGVPHTDYLKGRLSKADKDKVMRHINIWTNANMCVVDGKWSATEIRNKCIKEKYEKGLDMVIIDLLGLMKKPENLPRDHKEHHVFNRNAELLQDLGGELEIPILTMAHLNRERFKRPDGKPILSDLREAGEQFADNVIFINRPYLRTKDPNDANFAELLIAKNRDGDVGMIELGFDGPTTNFYNLSKRNDAPPVRQPEPEPIHERDEQDMIVFKGGIQ